MRFYLGVGKYTPNAAVYGEMGWVPPIVRQWKSIAIFWARISQTNKSRLNKCIAVWANSQSIHCKNWFHFVQKQFLSLNPTFDLHLSGPLRTVSFTQEVERTSMDLLITEWLTTLNSTAGTSGKGHVKLRTYRTFKDDFKAEEYCKSILPPSHSSSLCKFRCGVASIETGRFENLKMDERKCPFCSAVEDESH